MRSIPLIQFTIAVSLFTVAKAEIRTKRVDIQVDGARPIAGERSRFATSPTGEVVFTYTLTAGEFSCKPLGRIDRVGIDRHAVIQMGAIDSESTWNVDGWATYGSPTDLAFDKAGNLHIATRHRGPPYGVDYWHQVNETWRLESFGAGVTYGGNNVSLKILPNNRPVVVCLDRNRTRLAVWERSLDGKWSATRPEALTDVSGGQFELEVLNDGSLAVLMCPSGGGPFCATRDKNKNWTKQRIADVPVARWIASTIDATGALHVSFASGPRAAGIKTLQYAKRSADGTWSSQVVAKASNEQHVGHTDISSTTDRIGVVWEQGLGNQFAPKDYGGLVGSTHLTLIDDDGPKTEVLAEKHAGRPSLAFAADGKTAWVGVYTGNAKGDDFYLLHCSLEGKDLPATEVSNGQAADFFRVGCLKDIRSGNAKAERRGLQRIDLSGLPAKQRSDLIGQFIGHADPKLRLPIVRELAKSSTDITLFANEILKIVDDPDRLVRKSLLEGLAKLKSKTPAIAAVIEKAIATDDAMTRLAVVELLRLHPDWIAFKDAVLAVQFIAKDLDSADSTKSGAAAFALERMIDIHSTRDQLRTLNKTGTIRQRVWAALILFRASENVDVSSLETVATEKDEIAQLALCGLLGQKRSAGDVELLTRLVDSPYAAVRSAAVYALRSVAHVSVLKPVAKHPRGFDLLALRSVEPSAMTESQQQTNRVATNALVDALKHRDPNVRQKACDALNHIRAVHVLPSILKLKNDPDLGVQLAARTAGQLLAGQPHQALIDLQAWQQASAERTEHQTNTVYRPPTLVTKEVVQVGTDKQLLIDDLVIEKTSGLQRRLHPFKKHSRNPVFQAQVPWEEGWADTFMSTVIYDQTERCFKMWYRCGPRHSLKGYAVSEDGVNWQRPDIAESEWHEYKRHNLLGFDGKIATWQKPGNNVQVFPDAEGDNRFLSLFYQPRTKDYAVSRSANGVRWTLPKTVRQAHGDVQSLIWDAGRQKYLFFPKYKREHDGHVRRSFAATVLTSIDDPFTARFPFLAGHSDDAQVADYASRAYGSLLKDTLRLSDFHSEIYSVTAIPYEGVVVAMYDSWPVIGSAEGPLDMPLKVSRDMQTWTAIDHPRRALSIGRFGEWDSGMVYGGNTMLVVDDEIRLYYLGANMGHCTRVLPTTKPYHTLGVGLATLRLDGFVSLRSASKPAEFTTKLLNVKGSTLQINAKCQRNGWVKAELLDSTGKPLPGFSFAECQPFTGDSLRHSFRWKNNPEIPTTAPLRLRIVSAATDLFAFQFVK